MDVDQAKAEWPQLAELIDSARRRASPSAWTATSQFGVASDRSSSSGR
jgi:hypothetical protein